MASAALVACLSNPVSAMEHVNDDQDPGCCPRVKNAVIKTLENVALSQVRTLAQAKVSEEINKKIQETTGIQGYMGAGLVSKVLAFPIEMISNTAITSATDQIGVVLENLRTGKSTLPPKIKVALKDSVDEALIPLLNGSKPLIKPALERFAEKATNCISVGAYAGLSGLTYLVSGYEYASAVLVVGAIDVIPSLIADKAGYLKKSLKSMFGFDKIVDTAEAHVLNTIDSFDSNSVLKLYNLDVTKKEREEAKAFDEAVNTESTSYWDKAKKYGNYISLGMGILGVALPVETNK
jgi:hypothetical protein